MDKQIEINKTDYNDIVLFLSKTEGIELLTKIDFLEIDRVLNFKVRNNIYSIEYHANYCTLYIGKRDFGNPSMSFKSIGLYSYSCRSNKSIYFCDEFNKGAFNKLRPIIKFEIPIKKSNE